MFLNRLILFLLIALVACTKNTETSSNSIVLKQGEWRMEMDLGEKKLPFNFSLTKVSDGFEMLIKNASEEILVNDIKLLNDSLIVNLPIFESTFFLKIIDSLSLEGIWVNYYKSADYKVPVSASYGENMRFNKKGTSEFSVLSTRYKAIFDENTADSFDAIALFEQNKNHVTGTFATETGDYRYLEGMLTMDSLFLSTFDGSHAFLFEAHKKNDTLFGKFWSGIHYKASWIAFPDTSFELRNPDSLTFLKEGYDSFDFSLPDLKGDTVSLSDEAFRNKVVIVQIMGSWCPNCLDETKYLSQLYDSYKADGLAIVALAFERTKSKEKAVTNLKNLTARTGLKYPLLLGGSNKSESPAKALPMLNHIMSYPTAIFIDKKGAVRKIHTGFYGPGTGHYYKDFTEKTEKFIEDLLRE